MGYKQYVVYNIYSLREGDGAREIESIGLIMYNHV